MGLFSDPELKFGDVLRALGHIFIFDLLVGEGKAKEAKRTPCLMFPSLSSQIIASPAGGSGSASNGCDCRGQQLNYMSGSGETPGSFSCPATDFLPDLGQGRWGPVPKGSWA